MRHATFVVILTAVAACAPARLIGEPLPSPIAPNFVLTDGATGETVELSSLSGRVVLLTFLFTTCVDTCPLTAETIRSARDKLGDPAKDVAFVAISVDPIGDTPAATQRFVQDHRLVGTLRYLVGSRADLARVWQDYGIVQIQGSQSVAHSDVIYLVDRHARARVLLHSTVTAEELATDLRILTSER